MTIRRMIPALTFAAALALGQTALAQETAPATQPAQELAQDTAETPNQSNSGEAAPETGLTLADLGKDQKLATAFEKMADGHQLPAWLREGAVVSPSQKVAFGGTEYLAMTACEQHNCAENQMAVLYAPDSGTAYGVLSVRDGEGAELLTWLGMAGGPETIDGRTILYAALSGSLANHPADFIYAE
ncbi:C-lysozyme inhibitor [Paracoccus methylovorus]|uniref:C-lysozyme inhibitor n=1 Tax=Paracoccus methylovorus TaxID=2812658 RepID=A0ABX7JRP8_9RHOB|nr:MULTISPECIES: Ivy family c-type lysozyme inhibitor [Paracoccus]QRZ15903.1 C-lysozyme inhibitor [Paracoccus methylovorus]